MRRTILPLLTFVLAVLAGLAVLSPPRLAQADDDLRRVPNLLRRTPSEVRRLLGALGLTADSRGEIVPTSEAFVVHEQAPVEGVYVARGSHVRVTWRGQPLSERARVPVPVLEGLTREQAERVCAGVGLAFSPRYSSAFTHVTRFRVWAQTPAAGYAAIPGSTVFGSISVPEGERFPDAPLTEVPALEGKTWDEVSVLLSRAGLRPSAGPTYSRSGPGTPVVALQSPIAGARVRRESVVSIGWRVLGSGGDRSPRAVVPDLARLTLEDARARLLAAGLVAEPGYVLAPAGTAERGRVYEQSPSAGTSVARGTSVRFRVNMLEVRRRESVAVPNLFNMTPNEALAALGAAGFRLSATRVFTPYSGIRVSDLPARPLPGRVWHWNPSGRAPAGTEVVLSVVRDVEVPATSGDGTYAMPEIRGLTPDAARRLLSAAGLRMGNVFESAHMSGYAPRGTVPGTIWKSHPPAGSRVRVAQPVDVDVYTGRDVARLPDVRGQSLARARATLTAAGFVPVVVGAPAGVRDTLLEVSETTPPAWSTVPSPYRVELRVRVKVALVPPIVGLTKEAAIEALRRVGLGADSSGPATVRAGWTTRVVSSDPRANTLIPVTRRIAFRYEAAPRAGGR